MGERWEREAASLPHPIAQNAIEWAPSGCVVHLPKRLVERKRNAKSSALFVALLSKNQDRCEQTVFKVADDRPQEETCGSQKNEQRAPRIQPCLVRPGEIRLAPAKHQQGRKARQVNRHEQYRADAN